MGMQLTPTLVQDRLSNATDVELLKLRVALRLEENSDHRLIHEIYFEAAGKH